MVWANGQIKKVAECKVQPIEEEQIENKVRSKYMESRLQNKIVEDVIKISDKKDEYNEITTTVFKQKWYFQKRKKRRKLIIYR